MRLRSAPLAMQWPWPRCVEMIRSSRLRVLQTPTANASRHRPLADIAMHDAVDLPGEVVRRGALLKAPDHQHLAQHLALLVRWQIGREAHHGCPSLSEARAAELLENWAFGPAISSSRVGILANVSNPMLSATLPQLRSVAEALRVTIDVFEVRSSGDGCSVHLSASAVLPIETVNSRALASVARCCRSPHRIDDWARLANIGGLDAVKYLDDDRAR